MLRQRADIREQSTPEREAAGGRRKYVTVGDGPVNQGIGGLVEDPVWGHTGARVQHHVKSTNQQTCEKTDHTLRMTTA